jgi:TatD DNase family protein
MFYDAHLHGGMFPDLGHLLRKLKQEEIAPLLVGTTLEESLNTLASLSSLQVKPYVFVGVHPWYLNAKGVNLELLQKCYASGMVIGIGECGLDKRIDTDMRLQEDALRLQLSFAKEHHLCVNLHVRNAHEPLKKILRNYQGACRGFIHNFTFSYEVARDYLDLGYKLSVGFHLLKTTQKMVDVLKKVGVSSLVLESDADYLHSGQYDASSLKKCHAVLAEILNLDNLMLCNALENNIKEITGC